MSARFVHVLATGAILIAALSRTTFASPPVLGRSAERERLGAAALVDAVLARNAGVKAPAAAAELFAGRDNLSSQALVAAVLKSNPSLAALRAAVEAAASRVEPAGALEDPMLSYGLPPNTLEAGTFRSGRTELSQSIPWPGTLALRETAARDRAEAAEAGFADLRLEIIAAVKAAFAEWYYVHRALAINEANQALLIQLRNVAQTQYATGRATQQDVLQAEVELAGLQEQELGLKRQRRSIRAQINALLNRAADQPLLPPVVRVQPAPVPPFEALQQTAIETHPELERLQAQLAAQRAEVGLANKNFYPDFQLSTGYNSLWEEEDKRWSVGVSINIPWNRSKYRSLLDAAQAEAMRARWQLVDRRAELLAELVRTRAELVESSEVIELYQERLVPLARDNLDAALADYRAGAGDFLEVITAETKKLMTELRLARARADYLRRLAALERWSNRGLGVDAAARNIRQPFEELTVGGSAAGAEVKDNEIE